MSRFLFRPHPSSPIPHPPIPNPFSYTPQRRKYLAHLCSMLFVSVVFLAFFLGVRSSGQAARRGAFDRVAPYVNLPALDLTKPLHKALLQESLDVFYPEAAARNDSLALLAQRYAAMDYAELQQLLRSGPGLTLPKLLDLAAMYANFLLAYLVVMALTYYGVQTMAVCRYIREKQNRHSALAALWRLLAGPASLEAAGPRLRTGAFLLLKAAGAAVGLLALFSPAYVLAYSFRSRFDTDTFFFMVLLGALSNGLLVTYAQKFYTFLAAEGRKGYVETAVVKNLQAGYETLSMRDAFRLRKRFPGHVFQHIFLNARYQYILTLKEQASFLITGLIIIEMALNIHGHLCYELLQHILYEQYDIALTILLGLFLAVKATEIGVDLWKDHVARRYENR